MLELLLRVSRFLAVLLAIAIVVEAVIPQRPVMATVRSHRTVQVDNRGKDAWGGTTWSHSTEYLLALDAPHAPTCSVGQSTYAALQDGDEVVLDLTPMLRHCVRLTRTSDQQVFVVDGLWRWGSLVAAVGLCLYAFGVRPRSRLVRWLLSSDLDDDDEVRGPVHDTRNRRRYR